MTLNGCIVALNTAIGKGGGIDQSKAATVGLAASISLTDTTVSGNSAILGGGIYNKGAGVRMTNCTISGNTAKVIGGGIANKRSLDMFNCTVYQNIAEGGPNTVAGGGLYNGGSPYAWADLYNCTLADNTSLVKNGQGGGGAIFNAAGA